MMMTLLSGRHTAASDSRTGKKFSRSASVSTRTTSGVAAALAVARSRRSLRQEIGGVGDHEADIALRRAAEIAARGVRRVDRGVLGPVATFGEGDRVALETHRDVARGAALGRPKIDQRLR